MADLGVVVEAIPLAPPRVSLLSSVDVTEAADEREWANGIRFLPEACAPPDDPYWWACVEGAGSAPDYTKDVPAAESVVRARPFDVWVGFMCSALNAPMGDEMVQRANRAMRAFESHLLERELWTGAVATAAGFPNDFLTNSPDAINSNSDTPYVTALAELEQALATCQPGQVGVIHAQPRTVTVWLQNGLVTPEANGRRLRTALGTIVVPGSGYTGTGTGLAAATKDSAFAYGTGMVRVLLGPIRRPTYNDASPPGLDVAEVERSQNTGIVRVERAAVVAWDECCQVAVRVDHNVAT